MSINIHANDLMQVNILHLELL